MLPALLKIFTNNWRPILFGLLVIILYCGGYYHGHHMCELNHKAELAQLEKRAEQDLQVAIDKHIAQEKNLQEIAAKAADVKSATVTKNINLRKQGEKIIDTDKIYDTCVVPTDGVQYIRSHH